MGDWWESRLSSLAHFQFEAALTKYVGWLSLCVCVCVFVLHVQFANAAILELTLCLASAFCCSFVCSVVDAVEHQKTCRSQIDACRAV